MQKAVKTPDAKAAVEKESKKLQTFQRWKLDKVKSKKRVILEAHRNESKVHFASLLDLCHLKNAELRVFWKLVNLQDCVWENLYQIIMKTILQEKETIHNNITIWYTNLLLCLKP